MTDDLISQIAMKLQLSAMEDFNPLEYDDIYLRDAKMAVDLAKPVIEAPLRARIAELEAALREAYEVYAGSDGFIPETAAEGYQQQLIKQMVDIIGAALAKENADIRAARAALGDKNES
jgi:hypothetical protein